MEELYSIMRNLLEVEYNQESLLCLLKIAEAAYSSEERAETEMVINSTKYYLVALQKELKAAICRLDLYIAEKANKR
ncbi:MAG: hypothetical protein HDR28_03435 [Lachnospiraceae bacterium]|nr:hypothetical protein [Lachnospiraceae bacterium]